MSLPPRLAAFLRNDLDHAPFGFDLLRGLTAARLALAAALCLAFVVVESHSAFATSAFNERLLLSMMRSWGRVFLAALPLILLIVAVDRLTVASSSVHRACGFVIATLIGAAAFSAILVVFLPTFLYAAGWSSPFLPVRFYQAAITGALLSAVLIFAAREREAGKQLLRSRLARVAAERQMAEARLLLLRAQIEPHFLFNSLASAKLLCESDVAGGRHLLRNMGAYLRTAMARDHGEQSTLGEQMKMARSFLEIFKERMGERLSLRIDLPAELRLAVVPTLMIPTLVENAVKHGIGPKGAGGTIAVTAHREGEALKVEVVDDGVGFRHESGSGVGLANTRARLASLYGERAELDLRNNDAGGVTASIRLPLSFDAPTACSPLSRPKASVEVLEDSARDTFWRRFFRILSWKHWAWAVFLGIAVAALDRLRTLASPFETFATLWVEETVMWTTASILFMLAIVAVEATNPASRYSQAWRHTVGWLVVSAICGGVAGTYRFDTTLRPSHPFAAYWKKQAVAKKLNVRVLTMFGIGGVVVVHGALGTLLYVWFRNATRAAEALSRAELERAEAEQKLVASRLEAVEAEVDPAFMFGTLETIEITYERDRAAADAMLDELIAFLRAAIPRIRDDQTPVENSA